MDTDRLNQRPIFINGFTRGGTTLVMNLLLSHPGVCAPALETHQVFRGYNPTDSRRQVLRKWIFNALPLLRVFPPSAYSPRRFGPRPVLSPRAMRRIDRILYAEKLRATHERVNRFKEEGVPYRRDEIAAARLLGKNVDGIVYLTDLLAEMYPDATFFGLLRNGLAVCEGHLKRGQGAAGFGLVYHGVVSKMLVDARRFPNYHLIRFEDLLADPDGFVRRLYELAGLQIADVKQFRVERVPTAGADGRRRMRMGDGPALSVRWFPRSELRAHIAPDVNDNQIRRLSAHDAAAFLQTASDGMRSVGYL
jgi:hypothetical protein